jgi:5'-methylthioadenosine phosphorylase
MSEQTATKLGVIGGSGVYQMSNVKILREHVIKTPFGAPSDAVLEAELHGRTVYFLPRHGRGHRFLPTEVNYCANIFALKSLGVTHLLSVSAVGIMQEGIEPGFMVVPDQLYDRTKGIRRSTFFGDGIVGHVSFADPFCDEMRQVILKSAAAHTKKVHNGGAYVCMEGPQFSTRAESVNYRKTIAPAVIGMTAIPEAKLAREAEMCYAMLALATDYDCWKDSKDEQVSVEAVMAVLRANTELANRIIIETAKNLPATSQCECLESAKYAIMTHPEYMPAATCEKLAPLYGKYFKR